MDRPTRHPEAGHPFQDLRDYYAEAWDYIEHLEGMLGAGSLCVGQIPLKLGCETDMKLRMATGRKSFTLNAGTPDEVSHENCLPVLIEETSEVATWRFYGSPGQ